MGTKGLLPGVWRQRPGWLLGMAGALVLALPAAAEPQADESEPANGGWAVFIDNDPGGVSDDQNYTGGVALAFFGDGPAEFPLSLDPVLGALDGVTGLSGVLGGGARPPGRALEFGFASFTPEDITVSEPIDDDHPYACLPFLSNTRQYTGADQQTAYLSTLMVGILGTDLCEAVQDGTHEVVGSDEPKGWDNQISDGGEPTFRWSVTRRDLLARGRFAGRDSELLGSLGAAVGFTTGVRAGLVGRWGETRSRWATQAPEHAEYVGVAVPGNRAGGGIRFWELGGTVRLRAYNALLQGQFRDSEVTFSRDELRPVVGEAWFGHTRSLGAHFTVGLRLRVRSVEIRDSAQDTPVWLTFTLQRQP